MARENFLWGARRIHGELLMLGFKVSQATVSRYMPTSDRRPGLSWRTFIRLQALAFTREEDPETASHSEQVEPYELSPGRTELGASARLSAASNPLSNSRNNHSTSQVRRPSPPYRARASPPLAPRASISRGSSFEEAQVFERYRFCRHCAETTGPGRLCRGRQQMSGYDEQLSHLREL